MKKIAVSPKPSVVFLFMLLIFTCSLKFGAYSLLAQEDNNLAVLSKQVIAAKDNSASFSALEAVKEAYFKNHQYAEFTAYLNSLDKKKKGLGPMINYYTALARSAQLQYLEISQNWNEYFAQKDNYRNDIEKLALLATKDTLPTDPVNLYAKLLLSRFHREQNDGLLDETLTDLENSVMEYAKGKGDISVIKDIAGQLSADKEKVIAKKLYKIYVEKLTTSAITDDELKNNADTFLKQGNLELAESIYDTYIERLQKSPDKAKVIPVLIQIARSFVYQDQGVNDPEYAEKIFQAIEKIGGKDAFDEELKYLRAFNLEKMHQFSGAKDNYVDLLKAFPAGKHTDEALFKTGVIYSYLLGDLDSGKKYFNELIKDGKVNPQSISAFYHLGLLSQWQGDSKRAQDYYEKLVLLAKTDFADTVALAQARLKEISQGQPIDYNLRVFLDTALAKDGAKSTQDQTLLRSLPSKAKINTNVDVNSNIALPESGCSQVELQYFWSGDLGSGKPLPQDSLFSTQYTASGSKVINLLVFTPNGAASYDIDFVDAE